MNGILLDWEFLHLIDNGFLLLYGPIMYLYTKGVIYKDFRLSAKDLLHFLPYLLLTVSILYFDKSSPRTVEEIVMNELPWQFYLVRAMIYAHLFVYLGLTYWHLWTYRKIIRNKYSQIDQINLDWLSFSLNTFVLLSVISLVHNFVVLAENPSFYLVTLVLLLVFIFYFVNRVVLKALRQPEIFVGIAQSESTKYQGSTLTPGQIENYKAQLTALVQAEKPYLDPQVNLADLSGKLSISTKHLSQVINQCFDKSFFDFINAYRVQEVQQILNTAFKKETGQTPSEFRKSIE